MSEAIVNSTKVTVKAFMVIMAILRRQAVFFGLLLLWLSPMSLSAQPQSANAVPETGVGNSTVPVISDQARVCQFNPKSAPEMVLIAGGEFMQGSGAEDKNAYSDELPAHQVHVDSFAIARCEVTVAQFRQFVEAEHYRTDAENNKGCRSYNAKTRSWDYNPDSSWRNPGFSQQDNEPVVCISWQDAQAYCLWLNKYLHLPAQTYRLPSESEWEYAARAGSQSDYFWGKDYSCAYGNGADLSLKQAKILSESWDYAQCQDGYVYTAAVASFKANGWGLYDTVGNVLEWVKDCWHKNYEHAPSNGKAWIEGSADECKARSIRGGSWDSIPQFLRSASRSWRAADVALSFTGFRLARTI